MSIQRSLPKVVVLLCNLHDAWIVGSGAYPDDRCRKARDIDVMVPWKNWPEAAALIPPSAKPTAFGGWRWTDGKKEIDVWPDTLDRLASMDFFKAAWHPKSGIYLVRVEDGDS